MRACALGPSLHLREDRLVGRCDQHCESAELVEVVRVFGEALVVESVAEDALLALEPDVLDGVVEVVADEEAVELVEHLFGEQVLVGGLVEDAGAESLLPPSRDWVLSGSWVTKSSWASFLSSLGVRSTRETAIANLRMRVQVRIISPIIITPINLSP